MADHLCAELVLDALEMAVTQRRPRDVIHHADQGSQCISPAFAKALPGSGAPARRWARSVTPTTTPWRGAPILSLSKGFSTLECELLARRRFRAQVEGRMAVFSSIEGFYNPLRRHSALGDRSPVVCEQDIGSELPIETLLSQTP